MRDKRLYWRDLSQADLLTGWKVDIDFDFKVEVGCSAGVEVTKEDGAKIKEGLYDLNRSLLHDLKRI